MTLSPPLVLQTWLVSLTGHTHTGDLVCKWPVALVGITLEILSSEYEKYDWLKRKKEYACKAKCLPLCYVLSLYLDWRCNGYSSGNHN